MLERCVLILALLAAPLRAVDPAVADLSGTWHLNVDRSTWSRGVAKPLRVILWIEHREPVLRYTGAVTYMSEEIRDFEFDGAIDRKSYPMTRSFGSGSISLSRYDTHTVDSVFRTPDKVHEERVRIDEQDAARRRSRR